MQTSGRPSVALVGCGYWGKNIGRVLREIGVLAAIAETDASQAARQAERLQVPVRDLAAVLADPAIDALAIATPAETHFRIAREALRAGKHCYVEKPLTLGIEDAEELVRLAGERGRVLMVGHLLQYHRAFTRLAEMVKGGTLGKLRYVYSSRLNFGKFRREENILWSFAPHDISMILGLFGAEPAEVLATGENYLQKEVYDTTFTHLRFPGGGTAHIFVSWLHPYKEQKLVVVGDRGMMVFNDGEPWERKLLVYFHDVSWDGQFPVPVRTEPAAELLEPAEPLETELRHFLDCVAGGRSPRTDGREGLRVLRVLWAAEESIAAGRPVRLGSRGGQEPFLHPSAFVDRDVVIGPGSRVWHNVHLLPGTRVGAGCVLGQNVMAGPGVTIGDGCKIQNNVSLYQGVTLEEGVFCGPSCVFTNVLTPRAGIDRRAEFLPTLVRRGATIGANATILCGLTIGEYALVAAGAVVTRDVPSHAVVKGNPARRSGYACRCGHLLPRGDWEEARCDGCGLAYRRTGDSLAIG